MTHNNTKLHGCVNYIMQPRNFDDSKCNSPQNPASTISLKGLAKEILERNWQCNRHTTNSKNQYNLNTSKTTQKLHSDLILKHGISIQEIKEFLDEDWDCYKDSYESLELWAGLLFNSRLISQGKVPDNFNAITHCNSCGDVYVPPALVNGGSVLGCPWCWNKTLELPIPKIALQGNNL